MWLCLLFWFCVGDTEAEPASGALQEGVPAASPAQSHHPCRVSQWERGWGRLHWSQTITGVFPKTQLVCLFFIAILCNRHFKNIRPHFSQSSISQPFHITAHTKPKILVFTQHSGIKGFYSWSGSHQPGGSGHSRPWPQSPRLRKWNLSTPVRKPRSRMRGNSEVIFN